MVTLKLVTKAQHIISAENSYNNSELVLMILVMFTGQHGEVENEEQPAGLDMFETVKVLYKCQSDKDCEKCVLC